MKTTSYEISKKLKEAGFEDSYIYAWYSDSEGLPWIQEIQHAKPTAVNKYGEEVKLTFIAPAYDLETLIDALPKKLANKYGKEGALKLSYDTKLNWVYYADKEDYILFFNDYVLCEIKSQENESLADTAGKMWLFLKEKGVL